MNKHFVYRWSRSLLLLLVLVFVFCLTGCGESKVDLNTKVIIDAEKSGSRVMELSMKADDFTSSLGFSIDTLEQVLKQSCPKALTWQSGTDDGMYRCTFTLNFKDIEDYQSKVKKIIGKKAHVNLVTTGRVFSYGLSYNEDFTSTELIQWLLDALKEAGYLTGDTTSIFNIGNSEIRYKDQVYVVSGEPISFDNVLKRNAERVDVLTTYHENNLCDREVSLFFDEETMNAMGQIIKDRLAKRCPENASLDWDLRDGKTYCTFSQKNMTVQELDDFMKAILKGSESFVHGEGIKRPSTFKASLDWNETLDVSLLTSGDNSEFILGYYVKWDKGVSLSIHNQNQSNSIKLSDSERYPDYQTVYEKNTYSRSLKTEFHFTYGVKKIEVNDVFNRNDKLTREIKLIMTSKLSQEDIDYIMQSVKDSTKETIEVLQQETEKGYPVIVIRMSQSVRVVNSIFESIFGVEGQTLHEVEKKMLEVKHPGIFKVCLDFTKFIGNDPSQTSLVYSAKLPGLEYIREDTTNPELKDRKGSETIAKHTYQATVKGAYLDVVMETETMNLDGLYVLLILLCLILIIISIRLVPNIATKIWGQMKKGQKKFDEAFEGYSDEDQDLLDQRFEQERRRYKRDKDLRAKWKEIDEEPDSIPYVETTAEEVSDYSESDIMVTNEREMFLPEDDLEG